MAKATEVHVEETAKENEPSVPKFVVAGSTLICQSSEGELHIPLSFKTKILRQVTKLDEMDAFFLILDGLGDEKLIAKIDELDIMETADIMNEYMTAFQARVQATMGESQGSLK